MGSNEDQFELLATLIEHTTEAKQDEPSEFKPETHLGRQHFDATLIERLKIEAVIL